MAGVVLGFFYSLVRPKVIVIDPKGRQIPYFLHVAYTRFFT